MITEPCCVHEVVKRFGMWCGYILNLIGVLKSQLREQTVGVLHVVWPGADMWGIKSSTVM